MGTIHHLADYRSAKTCGIATYLKKIEVAALLHDLYSFYPVAAIEAATRAADRVIDAGGGPTQALDAADAELLRRYTQSSEEQRTAVEDARNAKRLTEYQARRAARLKLIWDSLSQTIQARLFGRPHGVITLALVRARRVLDAGGTTGAAFYHAMGHEPEGPDSAA